ncbi:ATP-dependent nuclease [Thermodesulfobacteriota bacterium B35]
MRLVAFSVTNYRSITSAHKVPISDSTILIGKNNEGKSNLLNALATSMNIIRENARMRRLRHPLHIRRRRNDFYHWERDFPISLQSRKGKKETIFRLEFELTADEIVEFKEEIKSHLNGLLPIEIRVDSNSVAKIKVVKKGRGGVTLSKKSTAIAAFIGSKIDFTYIPAVRTAGAAIQVVNDMLDSKLYSLESDPDYQAALKKIAELQKPILKTISDTITTQLKEFLPQISSVSVSISEYARHRAFRRQCDILIDDGTPTLIEMKGDGVKSLAALSLLRGAKREGVTSVLALEEPESHLHPSAIHRLREVIHELSKEHQVVVTTHCPLFVDRLNIETNILVTDKKAKPAKRIKEIRELLGVKASDNLTHAGLVLVVEGEEDKISLTALLSHFSEKIKNSLKNNSFVIEPIGGAGNLAYKLSLLNSALCNIHVYLDNDESGRGAYQVAENDGQLAAKDCHYVICNGQPDSEFEDMVNKDLYRQKILDKYGVKLSPATFNNSLKWSDRMRNTFLAQGKQWNKSISQKVKYIVAESIKDNPGVALNEHKKTSFDALLTTIEVKLTQ